MEYAKIVELINAYGVNGVITAVVIWAVYYIIRLLLKLINRFDLERAKSDEKLIQVLTDALEKRDNSTKENHDKLASYRKQVIVKCNEYAKEILRDTDADNVTMYEYCNGSYNLGGLPFLNFRPISEKFSSETKRTLIINSRKTDINVFGTFLIDLEEEGYIEIKSLKSIEEKYPELYSIMSVNKKHKGIFINLQGDGSTIGFISILYGHNKKVDYCILEKIAFEYSQKISNLFENANNNY